MLLNSIILAVSSSIDSLSIGITYGIKNTKISYMAKFILFVIAFIVSLVSIYFGNIIKTIFPEFFTNFLGSIFLIVMGLFICFQSIKKESNNNNEINKNYITNTPAKAYSFFIEFLGITIKIIKNPINSDLDNSNSIDSKEALFLGLALSLDCFCIGIGGSIVGINYNFFPFLISIFQLIFLSLGNLLGRNLYKSSHLPHNIWSVISGIILIFIGILKIF